MSTLHQRLKRERKRLGLSQHQLARLCDVTQPTIANWERGGHVPRQEALKRLSDSLQVDPAWLLSGENPAASNPAHQHLSKPIHHVPVFDWCDTPEQHATAQPQRYVTISVDGGDVFALNASAASDFRDGTVLLFDRKAELQGTLLVENEGVLSMQEAQSAQPTKVLGRLIYSMQPH